MAIGFDPNRTESGQNAWFRIELYYFDGMFWMVWGSGLFSTIKPSQFLLVRYSTIWIGWFGLVRETLVYTINVDSRAVINSDHLRNSGSEVHSSPDDDDGYLETQVKDDCMCCRYVFSEANKAANWMASYVVDHAGFELWEIDFVLLENFCDILVIDASRWIDSQGICKVANPTKKRKEIIPAQIHV